ncbi:hypothetical protein E2C01_050333 [Portunus trituberculatus]|uniref:Uncharacterized protein n=1 Tax=Portunus trituberculatus TaxID=210409 RepID=A0A5B7GG76_PORTR|nr:hypothetical protein [Portunus trituberculatus]
MKLIVVLKTYSSNRRFCLGVRCAHARAKVVGYGVRVLMDIPDQINKTIFLLIPNKLCKSRSRKFIQELNHQDITS